MDEDNLEDEEFFLNENADLATRYSKMANDSLLWGPYRSSLYFGIRPRLPRSLLSGLMWFSMDDYNGVGKIRHFYEQHDNMKHANWVSYDPRIGGRQIIDDHECHVKLTFDFVKSADGHSWGVKIRSDPHPGYENVKISFVWYSGLEGEDKKSPSKNQRSGYLNIENKRNVLGYEGVVTLFGISEELGAFDLKINDGPKTNKHPKGNSSHPELDPSKSHHYSLTVPDDNVWKAKEIFVTMLQESVKKLVEELNGIETIPPENLYILRDLNDFEGNLHFVQKIYQGKCEFDVVYTNSMSPRTEIITFENINEKSQQILVQFDIKFKEHFQLSPPFTNSPKHQKFGKEVLSGLLGGISYFYGDHLVDRDTVFDEDSFESHDLHGQLEGPHELFTLVPSRPFFPRGFLWDEGFHLLPLLNYDSDLVLDITKSWMNLIDSDGWIAREQILGPESRSRVPVEFQVQSPQIVNPPTLTLALTYLLDKIHGYGDLSEPIIIDDQLNRENLGRFVLHHPDVLTNYTREVYPKLQAHFEMFRRTQQGYIDEFDRGTNPEAYRWRGRTVTHCLASGLDDYPRALPADVAELNVDLLSWIGIMSRSMGMMAEILGIEKDVVKYKKIEADIVENLEKLHWSEEKKTYCDVSVNEDDEDIHVCHKGYISLFPFLTKLIPEDHVEKLGAIIDLIADAEELWTEFGIRSLSKSDEMYKTGEDYWRSPIWININYLILESIQYYHAQSATHMSSELREKFAKTYHDLRLNLVNNIVDQWEKTGFIWEQYNDETGSAQGAKNFLGWSSAVLLMMKMPENL
ncbi:CWH41 [[Candida] subhashii]|uniref:Mannosyl-oligosaccharide glucosidase n=1 Tax=[Candida] subhashii TaxID=561895 RepID=A0A8J5UZX5_9ASCO|nr:CWH41 [[Candida] subhashii]KAG7665090.1 CWH41 [[Candida] subhashii]